MLRASRLGDFVCATPAFRALRSALPKAQIALVGLPFIAPLATRLASLDRFFPFPGAPGIAEQLFDARELAAFLRRMQDEEFDLVVQMHGSGFFSNPLALLFGGRATAGFVRPGDPSGHLDAALPYPQGLHEVKKNLALTSFLGAPALGENLDYPVGAGDHRAARQLLKRSRPLLVGVHAHAEAMTKRWDPRRFAQAASRLAERGGGTVVVLGVGREENDSLIENLAAPFVDLRGCTSLGTLGAVIARLSVLLTNDSGPAHIAYALQVPSVTVFGSTLPSEWASPEVSRHAVVVQPIECRPCHLDACPIGCQCLEQVSVEQVVQAAERVMETEGRHGGSFINGAESGTYTI
ncbi:MAG: glycosyltransferase family 9 protein [Acidobacteriota bacterium]